MPAASSSQAGPDSLARQRESVGWLTRNSAATSREVRSGAGEVSSMNNPITTGCWYNAPILLWLPPLYQLARGRPSVLEFQKTSVVGRSQRRETTMSRTSRSAPKPALRTIRVWFEGRDVTDEDPALWPWPWDQHWADGWRPAEGPNSTAPGLVAGGVQPITSSHKNP